MADNAGDSDEVRALMPLQAAACAYRITFGLRAGQKVLTKQAAMPRTRASSRRLALTSTDSVCTALCAAALTTAKSAGTLCRRITRPALANERVQTNAAGQAVLKLKTPWRDGKTHLVMSPLQFMQRLAALAPEQPVIEKMLTHLGLQARAPPRAAARGQSLQTA